MKNIKEEILNNNLIHENFTIEDYPILYIENEQLILYNQKQNEKIILENTIPEDGTLIQKYVNDNLNLIIYITDSILYLYNIKTTEETKEVIYSKVSNYEYLIDDELNNDPVTTETKEILCNYITYFKN